MVAFPISDFVILAILTIVHVLAIVFTWKVGKIFNSKSWILVVIAFILLLFRRVMSFLDLFEIVSYEGAIITLIDKIYLPIVIWVLIGLGMIRIYYKIRSSMEIEKKLKSVVKKGKKKR